MKLISAITLFFLTLTFSGEPDLTKLRLWFQNSVDNSSVAEQFYNELQTINDSKLSPIALAYKGASICIMAKHTFSPFKKLSYLDEGMPKINNAVKKDINNIEIRYIRYCIESSIPSFLGKSTHIDEDIDKMVTLLISSNRWQSLEKKIYKFLLEDENVSKEQKDILRTHSKEAYE
jgi:hypothetical protein